MQEIIEMNKIDFSLNLLKKAGFDLEEFFNVRKAFSKFFSIPRCEVLEHYHESFFENFQRDDKGRGICRFIVETWYGGDWRELTRWGCSTAHCDIPDLGGVINDIHKILQEYNVPGQIRRELTRAMVRIKYSGNKHFKSIEKIFLEKIK